MYHVRPNNDIAFDSDDEKARFLELIESNGERLTPAHADTDGKQWYRIELEAESPTTTGGFAA